MAVGKGKKEGAVAVAIEDEFGLDPPDEGADARFGFKYGFQIACKVTVQEGDELIDVCSGEFIGERLVDDPKTVGRFARNASAG